jgi:hypothetical protein
MNDSQNIFFAKLLNDSNKTGTYINRNQWKEEILYNDDLINDDLEESLNDNILNYDNNFIEERNINEGVFDLFLGYKVSNVSMKFEPKTKTKTKTKNQYKFEILRCFDVITDIYLEIELDNSLYELTTIEKYSILKAKMEFTIGGSIIETSQLLTCIFNQICNGYNIKEDNNIIQIPIYNFNTLIDKTYNIKGFPSIAVQWCALYFTLCIDDNIKHFNYKLVVNGLVYKNKERRWLAQKNHEYIVLQNQENSYEINNNVLFKLCFNHIIKYILVYFSPIDNINCLQMNEDYPLINKATLYVNDENTLEFEGEDLLDFEVFGIKIYMLPFCEELSNFENIYKTFQNPLKILSSSGINFSCLGKVSIGIDFDNISINKYKINIIGSNFTCMQIRCGLCCLIYASFTIFNFLTIPSRFFLECFIFFSVSTIFFICS